MDIFSYAKVPNGPITRARQLAPFVVAAAVLGGFYAGTDWVMATGSAGVLAAMTAVSVLGFVAAFRFTRETMLLSHRASRMAADFEDTPPRELAPRQHVYFQRLIAWDREPVSEGSALTAMYGGLGMAIVPLVGRLATDGYVQLWATVAGLAGAFATLLLCMTALDHMAIRPVVGVLARAQLARLDAGASSEKAATEVPRSDDAQPTRARRPLSGTRR